MGWKWSNINRNVRHQNLFHVSLSPCSDTGVSILVFLFLMWACGPLHVEVKAPFATADVILELQASKDVGGNVISINHNSTIQIHLTVYLKANLYCSLCFNNWISVYNVLTLN